MGYSTCRICGQLNGTSELTDGRFIWPEGLPHDVRDHQVALPQSISDELRPRPSVANDRWIIPTIAAHLPRSSLWRQVPQPS